VIVNDSWGHNSVVVPLHVPCSFLRGLSEDMMCVTTAGYDELYGTYGGNGG
jgi:hypothetical protein